MQHNVCNVCQQMFADFGLSQWFSVDIVPAIEYLHRMEVGNIPP
jgi:hypothetical protein